MDLDQLDLNEFALTRRPSNLSTHPGYLSFLEQLNLHLTDTRADYTALSPYGSQLKGVAIPEESDFDILFIGGDAKVTTENEINWELSRFCHERFQRKSNTPLIIDEDYFLANLQRFSLSDSAYYHAAWMLAYPFIGNTSKIDQFRELLRERHHSRLRVDSAHAMKNFEEAIRSVLYWELGAHDPTKGHRNSSIWNKLLHRGYSESELIKAFHDRENFWRERMRVLFGM